ncbi:MAG: hypothetical protein MUF64_13595 [Polyangiaceae bacterium]|jgi:hypothetical protein|nr:hypothetical protein [Polyangiaceae bacterium]
MDEMSLPEASLVDDRHLLVADRPLDFDFFGAVVPTLPADVEGKIVYLTGDISRHHPEQAARVLVIQELSCNHEGRGFELVSLGRVPVRIGGAGVYFRRFFDDADCFRKICAEHTFQSLTESAKPSTAHRTGVYLTPVSQQGDALHFHLLRCSTNLSGPTENFRATDRRIVDALNREAALIFRDQAPLNHVLAQVYASRPAREGQGQTKARISAHADKTKDMPTRGIMAFCTFYDDLSKLAPIGPFDHGYKGKTGLTRLHFRLKEAAREAALPREFSLTLYPNSVFFMPLSTNRFYTHEIQPSILDAGVLPTRLGYVVRCSKTEAIHRDGATFLRLDGQLVPLEPPTPEGTLALRELYAAENRTSGFIDYGDRFRFSMNRGDYLAPDPRG